MKKLERAAAASLFERLKRKKNILHPFHPYRSARPATSVPLYVHDACTAAATSCLRAAAVSPRSEGGCGAGCERSRWRVEAEAPGKSMSIPSSHSTPLPSSLDSSWGFPVVVIAQETSPEALRRGGTTASRQGEGRLQAESERRGSRRRRRPRPLFASVFETQK